MKKILVGVKHREALESIRIINYYQEKNNWSVKFSLIAFFELSKEESEAISKEGIKFISADWQLPFIKRDGVNAKIIKLYKTYLTYKIFRNNLEKDYEGILISPGSFLLDQLVAFAIDNNIPSYVLQSGFIAPIEKEEKKKENINYLYRILAKFSGFFSSRLKLKENVDYPILLTFGKEYSEYLNCIPETTIKSISVGSPRFFELEKESVGKINHPPRVLYLTSSALYENEFKLHEMIKLQVTELIEKVDSQIIELHLRPHPRDNFNWEKDSLSDWPLSRKIFSSRKNTRWFF